MRTRTGVTTRSTRLLTMGASAVLAALTLTACHGKSSSAGGGGSTPSTSTSMSMGASGSGSSSAAPDTVVVKDFTFEPMSLTVPAGTKVTWKFEDSTQHTVDFTSPKILSPALANGQTFSYTFAKAGTYTYICSIHQYMHGTIVVK